jgi:hypothetical protein
MIESERKAACGGSLADYCRRPHAAHAAGADNGHLRRHDDKVSKAMPIMPKFEKVIVAPRNSSRWDRARSSAFPERLARQLQRQTSEGDE